MNALFIRCFAALCAAVAMIGVPAAAGAQSLADVARAEQARRKEQAPAAKVYTNDSVKADITPSTPTVEGAASAPAAAPAPAAAEASAADTPAASSGEVRDQKYWHNRMTGAREQLERSKSFAEALQTRVNSLTADFVNRDDPAQQALIGQNRAKAVAELDRVQREIAAQNKAIAAIEDEARKAGVPPGWLR
jgi:hypothetical protein